MDGSCGHTFFFLWIYIRISFLFLLSPLSSAGEKFALRRRTAGVCRWKGAHLIPQLCQHVSFLLLSAASSLCLLLSSLFTFRQCEHCDNAACSVRSPLKKKKSLYVSLLAASAQTSLFPQLNDQVLWCLFNLFIIAS